MQKRTVTNRHCKPEKGEVISFPGWCYAATGYAQTAKTPEQLFRRPYSDAFCDFQTPFLLASGVMGCGQVMKASKITYFGFNVLELRERFLEQIKQN